MREAKNVATATGEHEQVMAALRAGDLDAACKALKQNLTTGREPIVKWLRERAPAKGQ
jgi:DNA-binding GntR family transcriptional regulator